MPLPLPNLDDRDHEVLLREAVQYIRQASPEWQHLSPSDPGVVLLDVFVHLTDTMIHQLNRVPDKVYRAFLRMMGVSLHPPSSASTMLRFTRTPNYRGVIDIPRGTQVTAEKSASDEAPVFITTRDVTIGEHETTVEVLALHCEEIQGELVGYGTGQPGLSVVVARPPIIDRTGDPLDLVVGVEVTEAELAGRERALPYQGKLYRLWREVSDFSPQRNGSPYLYVADRMSGVISFAPALREETVNERSGQRILSESPQGIAAAPGQGREIRVWYRRGGGLAGNIMANRLTSLKSQIKGVTVTNPEAASGGRPGESLENALLRAPRTLRTLDRAVTADDYETLALRNREIARAHASTGRALWQHAPRGQVQVTVVPYVPEVYWSDGRLTAELLHTYETETALENVQRTLDLTRPLGTECRVSWGAYKSVKARATIIASREENLGELRDRVAERLHRTINPLPSPQINDEGWAFGAALRVSHIYDAILAEPGVRWVDDVVLILDDVPVDVAAIAADAHQPDTWYAGSGAQLFRSLNGGSGWEQVAVFGEGEHIECIESHTHFTGLVAAATYRPAQGDQPAEARVYVSADCGEDWRMVLLHEPHVEDLAWSLRDGRPVLFMATDAGLFEIADPLNGGELVQVVVDRRSAMMPFYAVTSRVDASGQVYVIAAAQEKRGVFCSIDAGRRFRPLLGMEEKDVRVLAIEPQGARLILWAGTFAFGESVGEGCFRWELRGDQDPIAGWEPFNTGWQAGGCRALAFAGGRVLAATHRGGVVSLNPSSRTPRWESPDVNAGLPVRDLEKGRFLTVSTVASDPASGRILAGVMTSERDDLGKGVYRTQSQETPYNTWAFEFCSQAVFHDRVTLPANWLMVSGEHEITVVSEDDRRSRN